jgi:hypothetical protein
MDSTYLLYFHTSGCSTAYVSLQLQPRYQETGLCSTLREEHTFRASTELFFFHCIHRANT